MGNILQAHFHKPFRRFIVKFSLQKLHVKAIKSSIEGSVVSWQMRLAPLDDKAEKTKPVRVGILGFADRADNAILVPWEAKADTVESIRTVIGERLQHMQSKYIVYNRMYFLQ